jgi:hypothetical protein
MVEYLEVIQLIRLKMLLHHATTWHQQQTQKTTMCCALRSLANSHWHVLCVAVNQSLWLLEHHRHPFVLGLARRGNRESAQVNTNQSACLFVPNSFSIAACIRIRSDYTRTPASGYKCTPTTVVKVFGSLFLARLCFSLLLNSKCNMLLVGGSLGWNLLSCDSNKSSRFGTCGY